MNVQPNVTELLARIAELEAKAAAQATSKLSLKVGASGTVCLYHGARYPIALYASQWERIIPFIKTGQVEAFITANAALLAKPKA